MSEHEFEPVRGLPGALPEGERILWQGAPDWITFARTVYRVRAVGIYFLALAVIGAVTGSLAGAGATLALGGLAVGLLLLLAWGSARTTVYTLTDRRVVIRAGVAIPKCFNLPLPLVGAAVLRTHRGGHGDIALSMIGAPRFGYGLLWPHARPWQLREPQPMLRAVPDAQAVAARLARACGALKPIEFQAPAEALPASNPAPIGAAA